LALAGLADLVPALFFGLDPDLELGELLLFEELLLLDLLCLLFLSLLLDLEALELLLDPGPLFKY